ncbi:MAG TPA: DUF885 family protein [Bryobacteraceae bacterium]|jgi:hypothetical protein|nr:DUF885 family protein [Bryobacteraceae bacterium]
MRCISRFLLACILACLPHGRAQDAGNPTSSEAVDQSNSPLRPLIERFTHDRADLTRYYNIHAAQDRRERFRHFYREWEARLAGLDFDAMNQDGEIDYVLFHNFLDHALKQLDFNARQDADSAPYVPFAAIIIGLEESRRNGHPVDSQASAATLSQLQHQIEALQKDLAKPPSKTDTASIQKQKIDANRAADQVELLKQTLHHWYAFYDNYDPLFTWWNSESYHRADSALDEYGRFLRQKIAGVKATNSGPPKPNEDGEAFNSHAVQAAAPGDTSDIIGSPIGRERLLEELSYEMIPYTPEELIDVANREFAWCESEMRRAANEMGFGDDWKKALEKVKNMYVEPGKQPQLIRELEHEAEQFVDQHDLVTIPPLARETWRMQMMSPERQLINPFFTGGDTISVSYPTAEMTYEQKMMSMRGNNIPFARATVFHELIPGHELQLFMADRYHAYRRDLGSTPFTIEGWSLYWELLFWDMKFQKTPEDRVGALFWRMHRCARIIFSLSFHLGKMTPDECVNFLVERVGHERENAIAEVRRSVAGQDEPLYQAAYLLGGMQLYSLHTALVGSGKMTNRQFNDAVLRENMMPIELIRASLTGQKLNREYTTSWKFLATGPIPGVK